MANGVGSSATDYNAGLNEMRKETLEFKKRTNIAQVANNQTKQM